MLNLIRKEAHRAKKSLPLEFEELVGIASVAAAEAASKFDYSRGFRLSTLTTIYIRNAFYNERQRLSTRFRYNGVNVSSLLPSQIPACESAPNPERQAIFRDSIEKSTDDAKRLVDLCLHTPKALVDYTEKKGYLSRLRKYLGWGEKRFQRAVQEIKTDILNLK